MTERSVFLAALEIGDPDARAAYRDEACRADAALRRRVEELLAAHVGSGSFMDRPATEKAAPDTPEPPGTLLADRYVLGPPIGEGRRTARPSGRRTGRRRRWAR